MRAPASILAFVAPIAFVLLNGACHPEEPPREPPVPSHPTDPSTARSRAVAYLPAEDVIDASIISDAAPSLDAAPFPLLDAHPAAAPPP